MTIDAVLTVGSLQFQILMRWIEHLLVRWHRDQTLVVLKRQVDWKKMKIGE